MDQQINHLTDIIDIEYLQTIQESLVHIAGITIALLDEDGVPVANTIEECAFCAKMQAHPQWGLECDITHNLLKKLNQINQEPAIMTCPHSGYKLAAIPILFNQRYMGSWIIKLFRTEDTHAIELTPEEIQKGFAIPPPAISEEKFNYILNFLLMTTKTLTDMAAMNLTLNQQNASLIRAAEKLDASLITFKEFMDLTDVGSYLVDLETGKLIMCNSAYKAMYGIEGEEYLNHTCYEYRGEVDFCSYCPKDKLLNEQGDPNPSYVWELYDDRTDTWANITSRALRWVDGRMTIMNTFVDITDHKREEARIAYLAYNDLLLQIPNAVKLNVDLDQKYQDHPHLIFFNIKGLKNTNGMHGRPVGDALLCAITKWFGQFVNEEITLYRLIGDDFAIMVENCCDKEVLEFTTQVIARFDAPWELDMKSYKQQVYTGVQIGIIQIMEHVDSHSSLLNLSERVMYFARKASGPVLYSQQMDMDYRQHLELMVSLKSCIGHQMEGFSLNYQPVVDAITGHWTGMEALCRWESPQIGIVSPDVFIQKAEQLGVIIPLGQWVLEESIRQTKLWELDRLEDFFLSVNLSPIQLQDSELVQGILDLLQRYDYPPAKLSLEITESSEVHFDSYTLQQLEKIKEAGVQLSLDDFGTGYSSFSNLRNLPISILKTDRSFINGIEQDEYVQQTLRTMVDFAHLNGLLVTAEGVETREQHQIVVKNGADHIQGYYFSRPLTKENLGKSLDKFH